MNTLKLTLALASLFLLSSSVFSQLSDSSSPKFRCDLFNQGLSSYGVTLSSSIKVSNVITNWASGPSGSISSSPCIGKDDKIYFGSADGYLYCLRTNGTLHWKISLGGVVSSSPAIDIHGNIYIGSSDNYLYSIKSNGSTNWRSKTGGIISASPTFNTNGDRVYIGSLDNYVYCLNVTNGKTNWMYETSGLEGKKLRPQLNNY